MIERLLCSTPQPDDTQRKKIFESKCSVNDKVCKLVIDSCSCENLGSVWLLSWCKIAWPGASLGPAWALFGLYPGTLDTSLACKSLESD